jgi:hypothetical protein
MGVWLKERHESRAYDRTQCVPDRLLSSDQLAALLRGVSRNRAGPSARTSLSSSLVRDTRRIVRGCFELFRVMQLGPQGFHHQTDQRINNRIGRRQQSLSPRREQIAI